MILRRGLFKFQAVGLGCSEMCYAIIPPRYR